jgi:hypothetical protein
VDDLDKANVIDYMDEGLRYTKPAPKATPRQLQLSRQLPRQLPSLPLIVARNKHWDRTRFFSLKRKGSGVMRIASLILRKTPFRMPPTTRKTDMLFVEREHHFRMEINKGGYFNIHANQRSQPRVSPYFKPTPEQSSGRMSIEDKSLSTTVKLWLEIEFYNHFA